MEFQFSLLSLSGLQMISTIAPHFELIKNCLPHIAEAINKSFESECLEIRMHAVKCLDVVGYWINMYLTNESKFFFQSKCIPSTRSIFYGQLQTWKIITTLKCVHRFGRASCRRFSNKFKRTKMRQH